MGKVEWDEKKVSLAVIAVMFVSLSGMIYAGIGKNEGLIMLAVFSVTLATATVLFGDWFGGSK
jgi:hypothetical protein